MPEPIIWDPLTKKVDDLTTIVEQIGADILAHNIDPSAHGQVDEAIEVHRVDDDLDHPSESVKNDKILKMARAYKFIVDSGGDGDFATIQPAIDAAEADGGGRVFMKNGIYTPVADIVVPSDVWVEGESMEDTIIDFESGNFQLIAQGSADTAPSGTISVATNDATVTGGGTNFDPEVSAGDYIRINDSWYEVLSITDDTHLELVVTYRGEALTNQVYDVMTPKTNIRLDNFAIRESGDNYGLYCQYLKDCFFNNIISKVNTNGGYWFSWMFDCSARDIYALGNGGSGILIDNCQSDYFIGCSSLSNASYGIQVQSATTNGILVMAANCSHNGAHGLRIIAGDKCTYLSCSAIANDGDGINVTGVDFANLLACWSEKNGVNGIAFSNNVDYSKVLMCTALSNGNDGMVIGGGASSNDKNIVTNNVFLDSGGFNFVDGGTATEKANNIITP